MSRITQGWGVALIPPPVVLMRNPWPAVGRGETEFFIPGQDPNVEEFIEVVWTIDVG